MSSTNIIYLKTDEKQVGFILNEKQYFFDKSFLPKDGQITDVDEIGLVYMIHGRIYDHKFIKWDKNDVYSMYLVNVTFKLPEGTVTWAYEIDLTGITEINGKLTSGNFYVALYAWRSFMVDNSFLGKYKVGIYLKNTFGDDDTMMVINRSDDINNRLDIDDYFKSNKKVDMISGPYKFD